MGVIMNCQICGEYSGYFPLCKKCNTLKEKGKIVKCQDCGTWYYSNKSCPECTKAISLFDEPNEGNERIIGETCLDCGAPCNGYFFCKKCYYKYRNKSVILKITNCSEVEILESGYESKITCDDGHPVKSQQEAMIDNYLFGHNIKHVYEKPFPIDGNSEHDLHPDFYLPELDIYIEHFGITGNKKYEETKEYKLPLYRKAGITMICTTGKDINNLSANLERKLKFYKKGEINYLDE